MTARRKPTTAERRSVLTGLATGLVGAATGASGRKAEASASLAATQQTVAPGSSPSGAPSRLLVEAELETLESLAEHLVPGAAEAGVPALLDRVAAIETTEAQHSLLDAVRAFEGEARFRHGRRWLELDDAGHRAILEDASTSEETPLHRHFLSLRDAVARAYFATEPGMQKLGWTRRNAWQELPGCDHAGDEHDG